MTRSSRSARTSRLVLAGTLLACASPDAGVHLHATFDGLAMPGLEVQALPYDPHRILDSLAAAAPYPRPTFPGLETELMAFVPPDERAFAEAGASWLVLRDSVQALADSLHTLDRRTRQYAQSYERFRGMYARLAERTTDRDRAIRELAGADRQLAQRARAAAESLRAWELDAYAAFDAVAEETIIRANRRVHEGATADDGSLHLPLESGTWWLVARRPDLRNPFREFRWSREVVVTSWLPVHLPLTRATATPDWRH